MSLLKCFGCDEEFATPQSLTQHLWATHLADKVTEDERCPTCDGSISKANATYHYPCFFDVEEGELGLFHDTSKTVCPLCEQSTSRSELESHALNHSLIDWVGYLGEDHSCDVCSEPIHNIVDHLSCLHKKCSQSSELKESAILCPKERCDYSSTKGKLLWHIWESHIDTNGRQAVCPGCDATFEIGDLTKHLVCIDSLDESISNLLPTPDRTCFICGLTVYDNSVLHRHFYLKHLTQQKRCPDCGEQLTESEGADIADHIGCVARVTGETPLESLDSEWPCPVCDDIYDSKQSLTSHVESRHLHLLLDDTECSECGTPISDLANHTECLLGESWSEYAKETVSIDPKQTVDPEEYFRELYEFNDRERTAERKQNRERYENTNIERLARNQKAIPELVYTGETYNPHFDTQLIYEYPVEEDESISNDNYLVDQFGIYPREIVLVGTDQRDSNLPQPGTVTFVDETTIGIAFPELDGGLNEPPLANLAKDNRTYHAAKLLNPAPYEAERKAIQKVHSGGFPRDIVLGERTLSGVPFKLPAEAVGQLNEYQVRAIERALGTEDVVCIHGPPGTGKTRALTSLIRLAVATDMRVLATSHSNQAVDNLLVGTSTAVEPDPSSLHYVGKPAGRDRFLPSQLRDLGDDDTEAKQQAVEYLNRPTEFSIARVGGNTTSSVVREQYENRPPEKADIVAGTMGAVGGTDANLGSFDLVIVDEAGQAAQPPTFIPASHAGTLVLAGDHLQLPPYAADEEAKNDHMHISLFEHLLEVYGRDISEFLGLQYRMNEQIVSFPNTHVYDGKIETALPNRDWQVGNLAPIMGVDIAGTEETPPGSQSKRNREEAEVVADHVKLLTISGLEASEIGVITPYTGQIGTINRTIKQKLGRLPELKVATVDSFQGSEREAIIVSWVRSNDQNNIGFLSFPEDGKRRLNVAMTRAQKRLVLIGDWNTLGTVGQNEDPEKTCSELFAKLYQWLNDQQLIKEL